MQVDEKGVMSAAEQMDAKVAFAIQGVRVLVGNDEHEFRLMKAVDRLIDAKIALALFRARIQEPADHG